MGSLTIAPRFAHRRARAARAVLQHFCACLGYRSNLATYLAR
jgi:hypothetical protein